MLGDSKPLTLDRIVRIGITAGLLWALVWLLGYLSDVLIPFAVALLLAYLLNPVVLLIQKKIPSRAVAIFITLFGFLIVVSLLAWLFIPMIVNELKHMGQVFSALVNSSELAERAAKRLPPNIWQAVRDYVTREEVQEFFRTDNFWKIAETIARKVLPGLWGFITGTASLLLGLIGLTVVFLYFVFLLLDYQKLRQGWQDMLPLPYREAVVAFVKDFDAAMNRYFRAQAAVASIVGILFAIGFLLIGLPMAIMLGIFIGMLNMVPYLQVIGLIPAFLLALVHAIEIGGSFWMFFGLTILVFVIVQTIQDTILVPKIMGNVTGLSPAMILLSLSIWGKLLGFFGLLIAIPITCLLLAYYKRFLASADVGAIPS
jgi:predicted PurR-regulated permease PerM